MGGPYLILCSENDDLAPYQVICNFAQRLKELGGDVKFVKMNGSPHVGLFLTTVICSTRTYYKPCCLQKLFWWVALNITCIIKPNGVV